MLENHRCRQIIGQNANANRKRKRANNVMDCQFCDEVFTWHKYYYDHVNEIHRAVAEHSWHKCNICERLYPKAQALKQHKYNKHKGQEQKKEENEVVQAEDQKADGPEQDANDAEPKNESDEPRINDDQTSGLSVLSNQNETSVEMNETENDERQNVDRSQPETTFLPENNDLTDGETFLDGRLEGEEDDGGKETSEGMLDCPICRGKFAGPLEYYHHANLYHRNKIEKHWRVCQECTRFFPAKKALHNHGCKFPYRSKCQFCERKFELTSSEYVTHANQTHLKLLRKAGWVNCRHCLVLFPNQDHLERHVLQCPRAQDESEFSPTPT